MRTPFRLSFLVLALVSLALVVVACGSPAAPAPTAAPAKPAATTAPAAAPTTAPAKPAATTAPAAAATKAPAGATTAPAAAAPAPLTKEYKLSMATGGTAGTYFPFGGAMASVWSNNLPDRNRNGRDDGRFRGEPPVA